MKKEIVERVINSKKNLIVTGNIGMGKTTNVIFPLVEELINRNESLLFFDSKEEYINKYYDDLKNRNYNIIVLNLRDMDKTDGWNPLEYPYKLYKNGDTDKALEYIEKIGNTIFYENSSADPFWTNSSTDFFTGLTLSLFEDAKSDEINFNSINVMFDGTNEKIGIRNLISEYYSNKSKTSLAYKYVSGTILAPIETKASIISVARQKMKVYVTREKLSNLMNKTTFNMEDIVSKPTAIFIIGRDESKILNTVATMFIEQLYSLLIDLKSNNKFNFILDNFDSINHINEFAEILCASRPRNIKTVISTYYLEDICNKYSNNIIRLSDTVSVINNNIIEIIVNNERTNYENDFETIEIVMSNIDYPVIEKQEIKLFDLKKYVVSTTGNKIEKIKAGFNKDLDNTSEEKTNIDELIKKIDEKIAQLEAEGKELNKSKPEDVVDNRYEKLAELLPQEKNDVADFE